jgi:hypothetical protein
MAVAVDDAVFAICALVGIGLVVAMVAFDDQLDKLVDALHLELDGANLAAQPWTAPLLGFITAFGVGGLVATLLVDVGEPWAATAAIIAGVIGSLLASISFGWLRRADSAAAPSVRELVGRDGNVNVAIQAGQFGSVYVKAAGQTREYAATAATDIATGTPVTVSAALGSGLVVTPIESGNPVRSLLEHDPEG